MTTYNCPRCGSPSTAERCPYCGRGPEPLLSRLGELDAVLATMPATLQSRAAVEAERREVLEGLTEVAARYLAEAERHARATGPGPTRTPPASTDTDTTQSLTSPPRSSPTATPAGPPAAHTPGAPAPYAPGTPAGGVPQAQAAPQAGAPQAVPYPYPQPPRTPPAGAFLRPRERGEVGSKTVQTVLLSLGGLLVAAALIIFTAVAWRNMGNEGRAAVLGGVTVLLLAIPFAFKRNRLWATAETFAALGALALWCTTLAGYYLYRPPGADFGPDTVGAWTGGVLVVLVGYRALGRLAATGWAMLPLAAVGAGFAAAGPLGTAVPLVLAIAAALGAAAWITGRHPGRYGRSDLWASRFLTCAAVVAACSAGLRAAFGLADPVVPPAAAAVALLAAANLVGAHLARRLGVSLTTMLVAASASGSLVLCAWILAIRADSSELILPSLALAAAAVPPALLPREKDTWPLTTAATAALTALAAFAAVTFDAPDLSAYFVVFLAARLVAPLCAAPLGTALRHASYVVGIGTAVVAAFTALGGLVALFARDLGWRLALEVPVVLVAFAFASLLLPRKYRVNAAALAVAFAVESSAVRLWSEDPTRYDAVPTIAFIVCGLIALTSALFSGTVAGRCSGWAALAVWAPIAGAAASESDTLDPGPGWIPLWLTVTAAAMLVIAAGAPRRTRPDRVLAAILAHVLAGLAIVVGGLDDFFSATLMDSDVKLFLPVQFGIYTLALAGAALMAPVRKWGYTIAALCTGTVGWWSLLAALNIATLECYTAPTAAILFLIGLWRLDRRPEVGSWSTLALPILVGIGPSLLMALGDGDVARRVGVGAAAVVVIIAGLQRRWQAPLVLGSIALAVLTINELALVWDHIPVWIPPAIGGVILIGAGATFEKRRRDLARLRDGLKSMR
ncbi:hypothetical protein K3N28_17570 [Glycomyces sp. TRM65418]|uniref:SCO7613 C-terminal domain-containing membrane protein n=1 Tax=Glycomyces sp. TRM65418 TaxID=2867006 RepID=UPI001CE4F599|nr:hypothetical protein [Glycomyces sp. TRM65418]MCC3764870.1 hypothetical protein [Glycomyces sp. TRM65418]QZD54515.1 hypothetical protein K3N28_17485 [Glycomyces sp. TRM65418]